MRGHGGDDASTPNHKLAGLARLGNFEATELRDQGQRESQRDEDMASSESEDGGLDFDLTDALVPSTSKASGIDAEDDEDAFILASKSTLPPPRSKRNGKAPTSSKSDKPGGTFQSLGLDAALLRALSLRGFHTPTPIQRASLPHILASPPRDVVGMARTGSGKTLAYLIPMIQRLGGRHSSRFGIRGLVLVPTRELALQVLKVGKDLAKGYVQGGGTKGKDGDEKEEGLRWGLIVGGDSLDEQFSMIASNPDVCVPPPLFLVHRRLSGVPRMHSIIATPGRLLHLAVEMNLSLRSVLYIVFDEADRLFDLGFSVQLHDILSRLPPTRQTLLFSATLPKSLVEFAKAGLQDPKLVRLDNEVKISEDLEMAFFDVRPDEKEAALLILLHDVIGVPRSSPTKPDDDDHHHDKKRKRGAEKDLAPHSTIIFTATKHHVEYLSLLLTDAGYPVSQIYSSLDASARALQLSRFRTGQTSLLVVTDLAARGIDVPLLGHVVNYDQPRSEKAFVHRVGRTARNGRKGNAWSLVTASEMGYLMDLASFLGRDVVPAPSSVAGDELVVGRFERARLDDEVEHVREALVERDAGLKQLAGVVKRAQGMYERSTAKASSAGHKKARSVFDGRKIGLHPVFAASSTVIGAKQDEGPGERVKGREELVALVEGFRPVETVFEVASKKGKKKASVAAEIMKDRRRTMDKVVKKAKNKAPVVEQSDDASDGSESDEVCISHSSWLPGSEVYGRRSPSSRRTSRTRTCTSATSKPTRQPSEDTPCATKRPPSPNRRPRRRLTLARPTTPRSTLRARSRARPSCVGTARRRSLSRATKPAGTTRRSSGPRAAPSCRPASGAARSRTGSRNRGRGCRGSATRRSRVGRWSTGESFVTRPARRGRTGSGGRKREGRRSRGCLARPTRANASSSARRIRSPEAAPAAPARPSRRQREDAVVRARPD